MDKDRAKSEIAKLVEKYEREKGKRYNEEATKNDFILPLFRILGWDTEDSNEVSKEENISGKRVDYGFRIGGIPKFFLEAKGLDEDLDGSRNVKGRDVTYAEQAINYAYYKGCDWAILTNFKSIRVYNAWIKDRPITIMTLYVDTFLSTFEEGLYLLSKDAFQQGLLNKKPYGNKARKQPITEQLLLDFTSFRTILSKDVYKLNRSKNLTEEDLDEAIQRLFDRLIFIRNCEDRGLEPYELLSKLRQWKENRKGTLIGKIRDVFTYFDETYNSKIFSAHLCDEVEISDEALEELINGLYTTENGAIEYDFSLIDADVLGNIYEQYLGHILKKTKERTKLTESKAKRKEGGIYYTPIYIVDHIVKSTVGEMIKDRKIDIENIKILDPACGSGSFLIKAFDLLNEYYSGKETYNQHQLDASGEGTTYSTKLGILKNNIFGVDLDKQAVDIAQLNLLLKVAEKKKRLPILQQNIKNGNSLMDDKDLAGDKAFKWEEEFKDIMINGGFDIIIGNPPWSAKISVEMNKIATEKYKLSTKNINLCSLFVLAGLEKLKPGGIFGFLLPKVFIKNETYQSLREKILNGYEILQIMDFGQFPGVASDAIGLIIKNGKGTGRTKVSFFDGTKMLNENTVNQKIFSKNSSSVFSIMINAGIQSILDKVTSESTEMSKLFRIKRGIELGQKSAIIECNKCGTYNEADTKYYGSAEKVCKYCGNKLEINKDNTIKISSPEKKKGDEEAGIAGTQVQRYSINGNYFIKT